MHSFGDVVGDQRRNSDAEIDIVTFVQFPCSAFCEQVTHGRSGFCHGRALHSAKLDALLVVCALDNSIDINTRRVDLIGIELADLHQLLDFGDANFTASRDHGIKIP